MPNVYKPFSKNPRLKPALLLGLTLSIPLPTAVQAAWLNAYGTPDNENSFGFYGDPNSDGYYLAGNIVDPNSQSQIPTSQLLAKLNSKGDVLWSKKINANTFILLSDLDGSGTFSFDTRSTDTDNPYKFTWGKAKIDPVSHTISTIFAKAFKSSSKSIFSYNSQTAIATGYLAASGPNPIVSYDAAIAKLDNSGTALWSHVYDYAENDSLPSVEKLDNGYLTSWTYSNYTPYSTGTVIVKLDAAGNIVGTPMSLSEPGSVDKLPSGGFLVSGLQTPSPGTTDIKFFVVKLDANLNYVWGKLVNANSSDYYYLIFDRELSDGTLEFSGQHFGNITTNTQKGRLTVHLSKDGFSASAKEVQFNGLDNFNILDIEANGHWLGWGNKTETTGKTGIIARFNENLDAQWMRSLTGIEVNHIRANPQQTGYRLSGATVSYGMGQSDLVAGTFDSNGNIEGCTLIGAATGTATQISPAIALSDLGASTIPVSISDKGPVNVAIEDTPFTFNSTDANLTKTAICADGKESGSGGASSGNKPTLGQFQAADKVLVNQPFSYTVNFSNYAATQASAVILSDVLPAKTKLLSAVPSTGKCNGKAKVVCKFGTVAAGASVSTTFTITRSKPGKIKNSAVVTYKQIKPGTKKKKSYILTSNLKTTVTK